MKLQTLLPLPILLFCITIFFVWLDFYLLREVEFRGMSTAVDNLMAIPKGKYRAKRISDAKILILPQCLMSISYQSYLIDSKAIPNLGLFREEILIIN